MSLLMRIYRDIVVNGIASWPVIPRFIRYIFYRIYGMNLQSHRIKHSCYFDGPNVTIGEGSFINTGCYFDTTGPITIGKYCSLGFQILFVTAFHEIGSATQRAGPAMGLPINIGNGCWIGARAIILPGVNIGAGCIIGAGALVNTDCLPNSLYGGVPAKKIKDL
jgi:maltose O-acetyltransferase